MDIAELTTIFGTLLGVLTPLGGVGAWLYRKQNKRLKESEAQLAEANVSKAKIESKADEWHLYKEQLDTANHRIVDLLKTNADKEDRHQQDLKDWQERYTEQTRLVRNLHKENKEYIKREGILMRRIQYLVSFICKRTDCDHGIPPRLHLKGCEFDDNQIVEIEQENNVTINLTKQ